MMACCTNKKSSSQIVDKMLRKCFYWLGFNIGQRPGYFIIVPILLTALLSTGFQQMDYNYDPEYLFSPSQGEAKQERTITEHYFPTNFRFVIYFEKYFVNLTKHACAYCNTLKINFFTLITI